MRYLGKISYGMYVYHLAIIWLMGKIFNLNLSERFPLLLAFVTFAITWVVAALSFHLMEKPIMDLKDRFFDVPSEDPAAGTSACCVTRYRPSLHKFSVL